MRLPKLSLGFVSLVWLILACRGATPPAPDPLAAQGPSVVRQHAEVALAAYQDAGAGARRLQSAVAALVAAPSPVTLGAAREAWLAARVPYAQTETLRFCGGPIERVELLVNTWPIDESAIDAESGPPGIINDQARYPVITAPLIASLNLKEGETNVTAGYHAIEYLLWGADRNPDGPGQRSPDAFRAAGPRAEEARRRATYLRLATDLLVGHLDELVAAWSAGRPDNHRARLLALPPRQALGLIIKGMGSLGGAELAGERLTVPLATRDQENEHSCFSDSTHADVAGNALGIENVCLGRYRRTDGSTLEGPGPCQLLGRLDPALGQRLQAQLAASVTAARAVPAPFDRAITEPDEGPGRQAIQRLITALEAQTTTLGQAAALLGLGVTTAANP